MSHETTSHSPGGRFEVRVQLWEARNSQWVACPELHDTRDSATLLRFSNDRWSLDRSEWTAEAQVRLTLRQYPGNHLPAQLLVIIDCRNRTASLPATDPVPLEDLEDLLERQLRWN